MIRARNLIHHFKFDATAVRCGQSETTPLTWFDHADAKQLCVFYAGRVRRIIQTRPAPRGARHVEEGRGRGSRPAGAQKGDGSLRRAVPQGRHWECRRGGVGASTPGTQSPPCQLRTAAFQSHTRALRSPPVFLITRDRTKRT